MQASFMFAPEKWHTACKLLTDAHNVTNTLRMVFPELNVVEPVAKIDAMNVTARGTYPLSAVSVCVIAHTDSYKRDEKRCHVRVHYFVGMREHNLMLAAMSPMPSWWMPLSDVADAISKSKALPCTSVTVFQPTAWLCGTVVDVPRDTVSGALSVFKVLTVLEVWPNGRIEEDLRFLRFLKHVITSFEPPDTHCRRRHTQAKLFVRTLFEHCKTAHEWALACVILRAFVRGDKNCVRYLMKGMEGINKSVYDSALNSIH